MSKIRVLKPFVFSRAPAEGQKVPSEQRFEVGLHDIDDEMAAHPWIALHHADGCIETAEQARANAQAAVDAAKKAADEADAALKAADATFARATEGAKQTAARSVAQSQQLNTPANQIGAQRGPGVKSGADGDTAGKSGQPNADADAAAAAAAEKKAADEAAAAADKKATDDAAAAAAAQKSGKEAKGKDDKASK